MDDRQSRRGFLATVSALAVGMVLPRGHYAPYYIRPEDFGAKADGVTNDYEAINKAVNHAEQTGGTVIFRGKTYKVIAPPPFRKNAMLSG